MERFRQFVEAGRDQPAPWEALRNQVFLGSDAFVERMQARIEGLDGQLSEVPTAQRRKPAAPLERYWRQNASRDDAIADAYASGGYSMQEIGHFFGLHYSRVSRILKRRGAGAKGNI